MSDDREHVCVVIPCYRVSAKILDVIRAIGPEVDSIVCVDDCCPENTGELVERSCVDPRVTIIRNKSNLGVGGAMVAGYRHALKAGARIVVKLDGDGQMDPALIGRFIRPLLRGDCDYAKGNRFFDPEDVASMPKLRLVGNAALSFMTKLSSGYWDMFDPTNGFTAIHATTLRLLPLEKLSRRWFFESDMLFRLNLCRAVVTDVPMRAIYGSEKSNLSIVRVLGPFLGNNVRNVLKRIGYSYFLRDFSVASLELVLGTLAVLFGVWFGVFEWYASAASGVPATAGSVMLAALPFIVGTQMLLNALSYDIASVPRYPLQRTLSTEDDAHYPNVVSDERVKEEEVSTRSTISNQRQG